MYKVITSSRHRYVGCSQKLAREYFEIAMKMEMFALLMKKDELTGEWEEIEEYLPH